MNVKKEDQASSRFIKSGKIGKPIFIRYSLSVDSRNKLNQDSLLDEVFSWMRSLANLEIKRTLATYSQNKEVLLISILFDESVMANVFLDFSRKERGYLKKFEVAATEGMYVFDSLHNQGFNSNCCQVADYQEEQSSQRNKEWLGLVNKSLTEQRVVYRGEV